MNKGVLKTILNILGRIPYAIGYFAGLIASGARFCYFAIIAGYMDALRNEPW